MGTTRQRATRTSTDTIQKVERRVKTYSAWRQYEFLIQAESLQEAYNKLQYLRNVEADEIEIWVDDKDGEDE